MSVAWIAGVVLIALAVLAGLIVLARALGAKSAAVETEKRESRINADVIERFEAGIPTSKGRRRAARLELERRLRKRAELQGGLHPPEQ